LAGVLATPLRHKRDDEDNYNRESGARVPHGPG